MSKGFDCHTTLGACWLKRVKGYNIYYPKKVDGWIMHDLLRSEAFKEFEKELQENGYDTTTLRISVKLKK